jgi:4-hydroxybenzoate polyprenyltransferase/phosphoserine phosphatase
MIQLNQPGAMLATSSSISPKPALCVDLDGTLIKSDSFFDAVFTLFRRRPVTALLSSRIILQGKAAFKAEIARHVTLDPKTLPYNQPLLQHLRLEHAAGRDIYLATGTNEAQAKRVADYLGIFGGVFASQSNLNLHGNEKLHTLERQFPGRGFDYIGNAAPDIPVLARARKSMLANPSPGLAGRLRRRQVTIDRVFEDRSPWLIALLQAFRLRQWPKNLLVFAPLLLAHLLFDRQRLFSSFIAFISFSLAASAVYILNDLVDVEADRSHPRKRNRPFAAGDLSPQTGTTAMFVLVILAGALASRLPLNFSIWLGGYFITTIAYSLLLKKIALLDVLTLAGLYTVRIIAGGAASQVSISPWLGGFSIFFFLSLAMVKRYAELDGLRRTDQIPANERGYYIEDIEQLRSFGTSSGYAAVIVFTLYINNPEIGHLYAHAHRLWLLTPVLIFWISRIWLLAHRGKLDDDPVVFALTDYLSPVIVVIALLIVRSAI